MLSQLRSVFSFTNFLAAYLSMQQKAQVCLGCSQQSEIAPDLLRRHHHQQLFSALRYASLVLLVFACPALLSASEATAVIKDMDNDAKEAASAFQTTGIYVGVVIGLCFVVWGLASDEGKLKKVGGGIIIIIAAASFKSAMNAFKSG